MTLERPSPVGIAAPAMAEQPRDPEEKKERKNKIFTEKTSHSGVES